MSGDAEMEALFGRVRGWPRSLQRDAVDILVSIEERIGGAALTADEREALAEAEAEFDRGEVAPDDAVEAVLGRYPR